MIYIAGKITGLPSIETEHKFQTAENDLHRLNLKVINPLKLGISNAWHWDYQMACCIDVLTRNATAIYLLKDWKYSKGARMEFQKVVELNSKQNKRIAIYFEEYDGLNDIRRDINDKVLTCLIPEHSKEL